MDSEDIIINVNKEDINTIEKYTEVFGDIYWKMMSYGQCFITSHDFSKEELGKLFGGIKV